MAAVALGGGVAATIDLRTRRIPNPASLSIAGLGMILAGLHVGGATPLGALAGLAVGLALMLPGHLIGATGAGDVKLFAAFGTLLGPVGIVAAFVNTAIAGGILAAVVAARRRLIRQTAGRMTTLLKTAGASRSEIEADTVNNRFAYGPAIAVGALVAALGI